MTDDLWSQLEAEVREAVEWDAAWPMSEERALAWSRITSSTTILAIIEALKAAEILSLIADQMNPKPWFGKADIHLREALIKVKSMLSGEGAE